jgi:hypothetical protein
MITFLKHIIAFNVIEGEGCREGLGKSREKGD